MNKILGRFNFKSFIFLLMWLPALTWAADISVKVDRTQVFEGESFQLIFQANGSVDGNPDFSSLAVLLDVLRQSENSNISIMNGSMTRLKTWNLTVMAKSSGRIQIPAISFGQDKSEPLLIEVKAQSQKSKTVSDSFYIELEPQQYSVKQQAQLLLTVRAFSDQNLKGIQFSSLEFNQRDVLVEPVGEQTNYQTKIANKPYLVVEQRVAIFPQQAGSLQIKPVMVEAVVSNRSRGPFGFSNDKVIRARSADIYIDVQSKENDYDVWLPASSLSLTGEWLSDPSTFRVGEPITRTVELVAEGLTAAHLPELVVGTVDSLKVYPDQAVLQNTTNDQGITGMRKEKLAYIPTQAGDIELPEVVVPWWDTGEQRWKQAVLPAQTIKVQASAQALQQAPILTQPVTKPLDSEVSNQVMSKGLKTVNETETFWWKWLALLFALAWAVTLWFLIRLRNKQPLVAQPVETVLQSFNLKALKQACDNGDALNCKQQLILWANDYFGREFLNILQIKPFVADDLAEQIDILQVTLYSRATQCQWNPMLLYEMIAQMNKQADSLSAKQLEPLHLR